MHEVISRQKKENKEQLAIMLAKETEQNIVILVPNNKSAEQIASNSKDKRQNTLGYNPLFQKTQGYPLLIINCLELVQKKQISQLTILQHILKSSIENSAQWGRFRPRPSPNIEEKINPYSTHQPSLQAYYYQRCINLLYYFCQDTKIEGLTLAITHFDADILQPIQYRMSQQPEIPFQGKFTQPQRHILNTLNTLPHEKVPINWFLFLRHEPLYETANLLFTKRDFKRIKVN